MEKPIATRTLYVMGEKEKKCIVEIFAPLKNQYGAYDCEVRISNAPEGLDKMLIGGTDSYQALKLAIETLHTMVNAFNKNYMDSKLRWHDDAKIDLGFSVSTES